MRESVRLSEFHKCCGEDGAFDREDVLLTRGEEHAELERGFCLQPTRGEHTELDRDFSLLDTLGEMQAVCATRRCMSTSCCPKTVQGSRGCTDPSSLTNNVSGKINAVNEWCSSPLQLSRITR
mmetsp:Transcript_99484/g.186946  ORF Transcript_99484/g.186946 Transcript_99484/m.186946 type:complete len:123 (+) Transcript_99484:194-562(+)